MIDIRLSYRRIRVQSFSTNNFNPCCEKMIFAFIRQKTVTRKPLWWKDLIELLKQKCGNISHIRTPSDISMCRCDILHWLPARQRIEYRMAALVWRCLLGLAPAYLVEFCGPIQSARSSRSL